MAKFEESKEIINYNFILCGATGSGKTSFLHNMGCKSARPNHTLKSGTKRSRIHKLKNGNVTYTFVDTVGLNDTSIITDDIILNEMNIFIKTNLKYINALIIIYDGTKKLGQPTRKSYKKIFNMFNNEKIETSVKKIMFVTNMELFKSTSTTKKIQEIKDDELFSDINEFCSFNGCDITKVDEDMVTFIEPKIIKSVIITKCTLTKYTQHSFENEILLFKNSLTGWCTIL